MPSYYAVGVLYCIFIGKESFLDNVILAPIEALGLQSVFPSSFVITHNGGTWFISCILLCYVFFPFFLECATQITQKEKNWLSIILVAILLYSPIVVWRFGLPSIYSNPFFRILEFVFGMLLGAYAQEAKHVKLLSNKLIITIECLLLIVGVSVLYHFEIGRGNYWLYSWVCLPLFTLILCGMYGAEFGNLKLIAYLSELTYAFFLVQLFLWPIMRKWVAFTGIENTIFKIVSSFGVYTVFAIAIHEIIEKPSKKWLKARLLKGDI